MFSKGPRFNPLKDNGVPPPGAYNPLDPGVAPYKRGGFLDPRARLPEETASETPGPNAYHPPSEPPPGPLNIPSGAMLKQQLRLLLNCFIELDALRARLEKEHQKELQQYETRALRAEARVKELATERDTLQMSLGKVEREHRAALQRETALRKSFEKNTTLLRNQQDKSDKYTSLQTKLEKQEKIHADERRRHEEQVRKLQLESDHQLSTIVSTQEELKRLECSLVATQDAHTELSSQHSVALDAERRKAEQAERSLKTALETSSRTFLRVTTLETQIASLTSQLDESAAVHDSLQTIHSTMQSESSLLRATIESITLAYSQYNSHHTSTPLSHYRKVKLEALRLELAVQRLERKLQDRAAQVSELAVMIRRGNEEKEEFKLALRDALEENEALHQRNFDLHASLAGERMEASRALDLVELISSLSDLRQAVASHSSDRKERAVAVIANLDTSLSERERLVCQSTLVDILALSDLSQSHSDFLLSRLTSFESSLIPSLQDDLAKANAELVVQMNLSAEVQKLREQNARIQMRAQHAEEKERNVISQRDEAIERRNRETKNLREMIERAGLKETALENEITQLQSSLTNMSNYAKAYDNLLREVNGLVARKALAEDEAERLSTMNAQILGHINLNQKIHYVDKLRKEMSDMRQKLIDAEWERDRILEVNTTLQHELDQYKGVSPSVSTTVGLVASGSEDGSLTTKARITRVERAPLGLRRTNGAS